MAPTKYNKQFCPKGHDTFVVGRTKSRTCSECQNSATLKWYKNNFEHSRVYNKKWYADNYEKARIPKRNHSWKKQGIINLDGSPFTVENYKKAFISQEEKCKICKTLKNKLTKEFSVDHCHSTGKFRGLLCQGCNTKVGLLENKLFDKVREYLNFNES